MERADRHHYRATESRFKGGAAEMFVTYDIEQRTRGGDVALYPKVKRVYVPGDLKRWEMGDFTKRSGRRAHGVKIDYEQQRRGYGRHGFRATQGETRYDVDPAMVKSTRQQYSHIVDIPRDARNVHFYERELPERYRSALQRVR